MVESLKDFMPKMGTGTRSSEDLSYEEAHEAMGFILDEMIDPVTFGAFTVAERWKSQSPDELAGFLDQIRETDLREFETQVDRLVDVSGRFDGKVDSVNTELAGSILASVAGASIVTHTGRNVPTQEGTTFLDILDSIGWETAPSPELSLEALNEAGFSYSNTAVYAPDLDQLRSLRRSLGVRCFLNTIESMVNPFGATRHVGSFYHLEYAKRVCDTFDRTETMKPERILMIQGVEGQTELRPGDCVMGEWDNGEFIEHDLHTDDLGLGFDRESLESVSAAPEDSADLLVDFVEGDDVPDFYRESVQLNAACRLYVAGEVDSIETGLHEAASYSGGPELEATWQTLEAIFSRE